MPPIYSAVKVNGVKLVDAARKGKTIERKARKVSIYGFDQIAVTGFDDPNGPVKAFFTVNCSKGTYIRTLCEDIGARLSVPACMESLERIRTMMKDKDLKHIFLENYVHCPKWPGRENPYQIVELLLREDGERDGESERRRRVGPA